MIISRARSGRYVVTLDGQSLVYPGMTIRRAITGRVSYALAPWWGDPGTWVSQDVQQLTQDILRGVRPRTGRSHGLAYRARIIRAAP